MKSNIEYLREDIAKSLIIPSSLKEQLYEWIEAIENELEDNIPNGKIVDLKQELEEKESEITELENEIEMYKEDWIDPDNLEEIDCGIGTIRYIQPDNVKLQMLMDEFKEQHELSANFSASLF